LADGCTISADQVAAEVLGLETRFTSVQLNSADDAGHGPGLSLAWSRDGKPMGGFNNPVTAFHRLFSQENTPLAQRQAELNEQRSILDAVRVDAGNVEKRIGRDDKLKLGEYLDSIRDIEKRLAKEEQWLEKPKPSPSDPALKIVGESEGYEEIKLMYDLMVAALQTDSTRVITYRQPLETLYRSLGISYSAHNISHYPGNDERKSASELRDQKQSELFAHLIERLEATKEPDGSSLFDHVTVAMGSNIHGVHDLENCPTLLTGGGAKIKLGQHLVMPPKTALCNLWLTLLQGSGIAVEKHGDSTGTIKELIA
jgi:Protein of unknown function (DUF1552)